MKRFKLPCFATPLFHHLHSFPKAFPFQNVVLNFSRHKLCSIHSIEILNEREVILRIKIIAKYLFHYDCLKINSISISSSFGWWNSFRSLSIYLINTELVDRSVQCFSRFSNKQTWNLSDFSSRLSRYIFLMLSLKIDSTENLFSNFGVLFSCSSWSGDTFFMKYLNLTGTSFVHRWYSE